MSLKTIKDVSFVGPRQEMVAAGSDCGRLFIWDRHTGTSVHIQDRTGPHGRQCGLCTAQAAAAAAQTSPCTAQHGTVQALPAAALPHMSWHTHMHTPDTPVAPQPPPHPLPPLPRHPTPPRTPTGALITALRGDRYVVNCIDSHPTAPLLASCGIDATVKLW